MQEMIKLNGLNEKIKIIEKNLIDFETKDLNDLNVTQIYSFIIIVSIQN